jgi:hypothetical protein
MPVRVVLIASAIVYTIFGVGLAVASGLVLALYGGMSMEPLPEHLVGAGLVGFAVVNWLARDEKGSGGRPVVVGNLVFNGLAFASSSLIQQVSGGVNALGWSSVAITLAVTLAFGYVLMGRTAQLEGDATTG